MNPMLQKLRPQPQSNPINGPLQPQTNNNPIANLLQIKQLMNGPNSQMVAQMLINSNPQLAAFVQQNKDRPISDVANQYGINLDQITQLLK